MGFFYGIFSAWVSLLVAGPLHKTGCITTRLYSQLSQNQIASNLQERYLQPLLAEAASSSHNPILLPLLDDPRTNVKVEKLSDLGFSNNVFKVVITQPQHQETKKKKETILVAKIFSDLAKKRLDPNQRYMGDVDEFLYEQGIGPQILAHTSDALLMEYIEGEVLTESMVFGDDQSSSVLVDDTASASHHHINKKNGLQICQAVGSALAHMHGLDEKRAKKGPNMLWHAMDVLLANIDDKCQITTNSGSVWSLSMLQDTIGEYRQRLEGWKLPEVLGHGDLKLSNVMLPTHHQHQSTMTMATSPAIRFIDFELTGTHYRGYDLAKFFRTSSSSKQPTATEGAHSFAHSSVVPDPQRPHKNAFWESYYKRALVEDTSSSVDHASRTFSNPTNMADCISQLELEALMLEPMTWLEAASFFLSMAALDDPSQKEKWLGMAQARLSSFEQRNKMPLMKKP